MEEATIHSAVFIQYEMFKKKKKLNKSHASEATKITNSRRPVF